MNMCLLEVAMCKKCRSSHFQSEGGVKSLRIGGEDEKILELGDYPIWGVEGSVPHHMAWLFQISHNCVTECTLQVKFLLKLILKLLEIPFFSICRISQYVIFLSNGRGKFKPLDLQGDPPPSLLPRLLVYPDLPMRKTLRVVGLLTVMIFFQSKKFTAWKN